jgi:amino acid transporter
MAEMVTYLPISSPFIRFAGRYVDEAFGVAAGYNFFVFEAALVPFEIVACNVIIHYWSDAVPAGGIIAMSLSFTGEFPDFEFPCVTNSAVSSTSLLSGGMENQSSTSR